MRPAQPPQPPRSGIYRTWSGRADVGIGPYEIFRKQKKQPRNPKKRIPGLKFMLPSRVEAPEEGVFGFPGHRAALGDAFYRRTAGRPGLAGLLVLAAGVVGIGRGE